MPRKKHDACVRFKCEGVEKNTRLFVERREKKHIQRNKTMRLFYCYVSLGKHTHEASGASKIEKERVVASVWLRFGVWASATHRRRT